MGGRVEDSRSLSLPDVTLEEVMRGTAYKNKFYRKAPLSPLLSVANAEEK